MPSHNPISANGQDSIESGAAATLIGPTCCIGGNGTAWFDDLEVFAYDRDDLPENFDATHGKHNRQRLDKKKGTDE